MSPPILIDPRFYQRHYRHRSPTQYHRRHGLAQRRRITIAVCIGVCLVASLFWVMMLATPVLGQMPSLTAPSAGQPLPIGVERQGTLETTRVRLDGQELFKIASPAVLNRNEPGGQIPVEIRAKQIEANLARLVTGNELSDEETLNPNTIHVSIETLNGQPVLFANDTTLVEPRVLLTVTDADAQYHSLSKAQLATRWQRILQSELRQALKLRQPEALKRQIATVIRVWGIVAALTLGLGAIWVFWGRRRQQLEQRQAAELAVAQAEVASTIEAVTVDKDSETGEAEPSFRLFHGLHHYLGLQRRLQMIRLLRWLTFWLIALVWIVGVAYSFSVFPQTRQFARRIIAVPIVLLLTWFITGLLNRLTDLATDRFIQKQQQEQSLTAANLQRIATIANVIKGLKMVVLYTVAILWVLQWLNYVPGSILTLGAALALVVSFAAQSLVKDLVNGFLILLEDQFRIGDQIRTATAAGRVENLNLRITQIRSDDGNLITLPNSLITQVENMSRTWARTDFQIEVAYNTDIDFALAVVRETVDRLAHDSEWRSSILDTHELLGVEQLSHTGIVIRVWIKTAPLKQWVIARELRRRLKIAFDRHHIQIGIPQQVLLSNVANESN
jgi:moderate conductance mechanosensitive channel